MGAFVLGNLSKFTFYSVMTGLCIGASFFFLLLSKPQEHPDQQNEGGSVDQETSVMQDIKETWDLFISKRFLCFSPLIVQSAFNLAI